MIHRVGNELADALVIKENRDAARADEHGHAIANYQCLVVVDFKAVAVDERNCEGTKRNPIAQRLQRVIKVFSLHDPLGRS